MVGLRTAVAARSKENAGGFLKEDVDARKAMGSPKTKGLRASSKT